MLLSAGRNAAFWIAGGWYLGHLSVVYRSLGRGPHAEKRINGCLERGLNGKALPVDGHEMKAILGYIGFRSEPVPVGKSADGRDAPKLKLPEPAGDPRHGQQVYTETCAVRDVAAARTAD